MKIEGKVVRVFPRDTNTDEIIAGKYKYDELDLDILARHTFESLDVRFYDDCKQLKDPIVIAGANFGCGSSREQAPQVLKACGISCIVADSFARIFYRNGFNIGLPLVECEYISNNAAQGEMLRVDFDEGVIRSKNRSAEYRFKPIPQFMQRLLEEGGLMQYLDACKGFTD
ncbi:MAG TPA: 3-isopropylmalate dehydratase [Candidatus Bathyarchaeia archaeon]|nr:3-isopropylmalate dehydratase [Candidatus Bathyarchaeia archaeon]